MDFYKRALALREETISPPLAAQQRGSGTSYAKRTNLCYGAAERIWIGSTSMRTWSDCRVGAGRG